MRANKPTKVTATVAKVTPSDVELSSLNWSMTLPDN